MALPFMFFSFRNSAPNMNETSTLLRLSIDRMETIAPGMERACRYIMSETVRVMEMSGMDHFHVKRLLFLSGIHRNANMPHIMMA